MDLLDTILIEDRLELVNGLLEKHNRTDLKVVAVNKHYKSSYVFAEVSGALNYYSIWDNKIRREGNVMREMGANFILIDERYSDYESVPLNKKRAYTTCARSELDSYLADGWEIERER